MFLYIVVILSVCVSVGAAQPVDSSLAVRDSIRTFEGPPVIIERDRELTLGLVRPLVTNADLRILERHAASSSLSQVLPLLHSSFDVRSYGTLGGISLPSFRGLPAEYISVYRNGIRLTNAQNSLTDMERYTTRSASSVTILSSTESAMYANGVAGAAVIIESQPLKQRGYTAGISLETYDDGGSLNDKEYFLRGAERIDASTISFSANYRGSNGAFPFYQRTSRSFINRANNDAYLAIAELEPVLSLSDDESLSGLFTFSEAERGVPGPNTIDGVGASTPETRQYDNDWLAGLFYRAKLSENYYHEASLSYQSQFETYIDQVRALDDHYRNQLYGAAYRLRVQANETLELFGDLSANQDELVSNQHQTSVRNIIRNIVNTAVSAKYRVSADLGIAATLRLEHVSDVKKTELLPAINLRYTVDAFSAQASFSSFFHPPTFNQLYWYQAGDSTLHPEYGQSYEVRASYRFLASDEIAFDVGAALFYTDIRDQIIWTIGSGGFAEPVQMQRVHTRGAELSTSLGYSLAQDQKLDWRLGITFLDKVNLVESSLYYGKTLPYSPLVRMNTVVTYELKNSGSLTGILWYRTSQYSDFANNPSVGLPAVATVDAHLRLAPFALSGVEMTPQLSAINLTNHQYEDALNFPLPGRLWKLSVEFTYPHQ